MKRLLPALLICALAAAFAPAAQARAAFPAVSDPAGQWVQLSESDGTGEPAATYVDAAPWAQATEGGRIRARFATIWVTPRPDDAGVIFQAFLSEALFDCGARSFQVVKQVRFDFDGHAVYTVSGPLPAPEAAPAGTTRGRNLDFVCAGGADGATHNSYLGLLAARDAITVHWGTRLDAAARPPAPGANWDAAAPPARGAWRLVDDEISQSQLLDTSSMTWRGQTVRAWVAVSAGGPAAADGVVVSEALIELDCSTLQPAIVLMRHLDASGRVIREGAFPAMDWGVFSQGDGAIGMQAICHPQRIAAAPAYETPFAFRARRGAKAK